MMDKAASGIPGQDLVLSIIVPMYNEAWWRSVMDGSYGDWIDSQYGGRRDRA